MRTKLLYLVEFGNSRSFREDSFSLVGAEERSRRRTESGANLASRLNSLDPSPSSSRKSPWWNASLRTLENFDCRLTPNSVRQLLTPERAGKKETKATYSTSTH